MFGSCADTRRPQGFWQVLLDAKPSAVVLLGDNVYADTFDPAELRSAYAKLGAIDGFQRLRASAPLLATWDDHDFGQNDTGVEHPRQADAQKVFLDFFDVSEDSPRRRQKGVYSARVFGEAGRRVQVILLDTRSFRSGLEGGPKSYVPRSDADATLLGNDQWRWLAEQLRLPAELRLIGSSIQFAADEHGFEKWANFPRERERLLALLGETKASGVVILSGDRHKAEISRMDGAPYPLYDVTSSALNRPLAVQAGDEPNRRRKGPLVWEANFGVVEVDWSAPDPRVSLEIRRSDDGMPVVMEAFPLSRLKAAP